jgi:hypothetical protein
LVGGGRGGIQVAGRWGVFGFGPRSGWLG